MEDHKKFDEHRRAHYRTGSLAALRAQAAAEDEREKEEAEKGGVAAEPANEAEDEDTAKGGNDGQSA